MSISETEGILNLRDERSSFSNSKLYCRPQYTVSYMARPASANITSTKSLFETLLYPYFQQNQIAEKCLELIAFGGTELRGASEMVDGKNSRGGQQANCGTESATLKWWDLEKIAVEEGLFYDHLAFRTFGIPGGCLGIPSIAKVFCDLGYTCRDHLLFPKKKLQAFWFAPPKLASGPSSFSSQTPHRDILPRVFISELLVDKLSKESQAIIEKYARHVRSDESVTTSSSCPSDASHFFLHLPWPIPSSDDYQALLRESEYAAWTLVNGNAVNHTTVSVHRLRPPLNKIEALNSFLQARGVKLNSEGGTTKVSPDGNLLQSSTVADTVAFGFSDGSMMDVPTGYIEFAERRILPEFIHMDSKKIMEEHRREGFETSNADGIFESTSIAQLSSHPKVDSEHSS